MCVIVPEGESEFMQNKCQRRRKWGVSALFYRHTQAEPEGEQDPTCSSTGCVTKPVEFAYWPLCHLRVKGQPHPALACLDSRTLKHIN